jgi:hypothetical protein
MNMLDLPPTNASSICGDLPGKSCVQFARIRCSCHRLSALDIVIKVSIAVKGVVFGGVVEEKVQSGGDEG